MDFLNSIATPVDAPVEWIACGDDLIAWLKRAELVPRQAGAALRKKALPGELDAVAAQARALREWFRGFVQLHKGKPLEPAVLPELEPLNQLLARDRAYEQIIAHPSLLLARQRQWDSADALLLPIADAFADLICNVNFRNVKACEGPACSLLYVDRTRTQGRRWCSMAMCGNRRKQAARRARSKEANI